MTERKKKPTAAARTHPEDRPRIEAMNSIAARLHGAPSEKAPISYYTPELIQCTLPHSDPKTRDWIRTSGSNTLIVSSGIDKKGEPFGIPYGSFPRLVLAYIITHVVKTSERRIEFQSFFRTFLKEVGYTVKPSVRHAKTLHNGLERLINASITYEYLGKTERARKNFIVAPTSMLFWNYKSPDQGGLWESYIEISEEFRQSIVDAPVPLRTDMLAALKKSPLAIDLYMWLSYRLFTLQRDKEESLTLGYGRLQEQFGTSISSDNYRNFRHEVRLAFDKVKTQWEKLAAADGNPGTIHCEMGETSLTLHRSKLLVARKEGKKLPAPTVPALDAATLRKARQLAGEWDVKALEAEYYAWLARKQIEPQNLEAHFLDFVRQHRERN